MYQYAEEEIFMVNDRKFFRHPTEIPIEVWESEDEPKSYKRSENVSLGGLAFRSSHTWQQGTLLQLRVPFVNPAFESAVRVVWCRKRAAHYEIGVEFMEKNDVFKARMVEQVCQIELYRQDLAKHGRFINVEEAALEWISRFADRFPSFGVLSA